jgi:hypothetical protein
MKTKLYLGIFGVLMLIAIYTFYDQFIKNNPEKEKAFKVENFEKVSQINITDREGKVIQLTKNENDEWILNNQYKVRQHLFDEMKKALTEMEAVTKVPEIGKKAVITQMVEGAIKVEVFKGKKKDKVIFIGGPNFRNTASNMFLEINGKASKNIYEVAIPGFRGYLTSRFIVDETAWRDKEIFAIPANDIKKINVEYFNNAKFENFELLANNNEYTLKTGSGTFQNNQLSSEDIVRYLLHFENQQVMSYVFLEPSEQQLKDSLMNINKYATLRITNTQNKVIKVDVVDMPLSETSNKQYDENGDPMRYDIDYKYAVFGDKKEWGVITNTKFGILLAPHTLFLKK